MKTETGTAWIIEKTDGSSRIICDSLTELEQVIETWAKKNIRFRCFETEIKEMK